MVVSIFELFSIGIGPSSSHTVGPMKAAYDFVSKDLSLEQVRRVQVQLYGSLALTGRGHGTDQAILSGLQGMLPNQVVPEEVPRCAQQVLNQQSINLFGKQKIPFFEQTDLLFYQKKLLPLHTNGMCFTAYDASANPLKQQVYYSIGGGFIVTEEQFGKKIQARAVPYPFTSMAELAFICKQKKLGIAQVMLANEQALDPTRNIAESLLEITEVMQACINKGCVTEGVLPGALKVKRRAPGLYKKLSEKKHLSANFPKVVSSLLWPTVYAMAVNEENAAGGRIVTAPTNGAAGIIPAVLMYYRTFYKEVSQESINHFLLTAGAIALLYKLNASISGAEVGCQGEVGVACSMASAALTAVLGGTLEQIENAAEMAMEHHLGMTCDPVAGLVQIPCIERNGVGAEKAIKLAYLALMEDGREKKVSLDQVIETMFATGKDMMAIYKETSLGGLAKSLAVNVPEC